MEKVLLNFLFATAGCLTGLAIIDLVTKPESRSEPVNMAEEKFTANAGTTRHHIEYYSDGGQKHSYQYVPAPHPRSDPSLKSLNDFSNDYYPPEKE